MKTYKQFCEHYGLDVDSKKSREEYAEYVRNLRILERAASKSNTQN